MLDQVAAVTPGHDGVGRLSLTSYRRELVAEFEFHQPPEWRAEGRPAPEDLGDPVRAWQRRIADVTGAQLEILRRRALNDHHVLEADRGDGQDRPGCASRGRAEPSYLLGKPGTHAT